MIQKISGCDFLDTKIQCTKLPIAGINVFGKLIFFTTLQWKNLFRMYLLVLFSYHIHMIKNKTCA